MSKKSISINPIFFKMSGGKQKKKKKPRFEKNKLKPNDIKKKLIAKIKAHQKREDTSLRNVYILSMHIFVY